MFIPQLLENAVQRRAQEGAVLILALMFLLVLTLLGLASMQNTQLQERMAGNFADRNNAFQLAELAVRTAERNHRALLEADAEVLFPVWPAACPQNLGCAGTNALLNDACLAALPWTNVPVADGTAEFTISELPTDRCQDRTGRAREAGDASGTGGFGSPREDQVIAVVGRGFGANNTSRVLLQTVYSGPLFRGFGIGGDDDD
ncbi:MAG: hypothetical protein EA418_13395 [Wenzhouxiangellaceae bacterium]|nr:MAG: hypothetical protein EA418_13395 [Wenzhouxiangellaceae bacterium]